MNETTRDTERRQRLQDWFNSNPEIWADIVEEGKLAHQNEMLQLKSRDSIRRDWSAGYVCGQEFLMEMERFIRKIWIAPKETASQEQT